MVCELMQITGSVMRCYGCRYQTALFSAKLMKLDGSVVEIEAFGSEFCHRRVFSGVTT